MLPVILFHAGLSAFAGGFVGVDVFFVISGFLITGILLREIEAGRFSIVDFYDRRVRRILPALYFVMFVSTIMAAFLLYPRDLGDFGEAMVATTTFTSNFYFLGELGYFAREAEARPLLHTWSLAVEEQYYIVFPILLFLLVTRYSKMLLLVLAGLLAASFATAVVVAPINADLAFYHSFARAWELLVGSLCALYRFRRPEMPRGRAPDAVALSGLVTIGVSIATATPETHWPGVAALLPTLGTAAVLLFAHGEGIAARLLSLRPLVLVGLVSYSAYLWHYPLLAFAFYSEWHGAPWLRLAIGLAALPIAWVSWKYVEAPFRDRSRFSRREVFRLALIGGVLLALVGAGLALGRAEIERRWLETKSPTEAATYLAVTEASERFNLSANSRGAEPFGRCRTRITRSPLEALDRLEECEQRHGPGVLILGDSHGVDIFNMALIRSDAPFVMGMVAGGCRADSDAPSCHYDDLEALLEDHSGLFESIVYHEAGFRMLRTPGGDVVTREYLTGARVDGRWPATRIDEARLEKVADRLERFGAQASVTWLGPRLEHQFSHLTRLRSNCGEGLVLREGTRDRFAALDRVVGDLARARGIAFLSMQEMMDFDFPRDLMTCQTSYWEDGDHLSEAGEWAFAPRFTLLDEVEQAGERHALFP